MISKEKDRLFVESYGMELTYGDIDRRIDIPEHLGSWEGPKLENGVYAAAEWAVINSNGTTLDPLGIKNPFGGEINTAPTKTITEQLKVVKDIWNLFGKFHIASTLSCHVHVYAPNISYAKLFKYIEKYEGEFIDICYNLPLLRELRDLTVDPFRKWHHYTSVKTCDFKTFATEAYGMKDNEPSSRAAINIQNIFKYNNNTIEFRAFRHSYDLYENYSMLKMSEQIIEESQKEAPLSPKQIQEKYNLRYPGVLDIEFYLDGTYANLEFADQSITEEYKYWIGNKNRWKKL